MGFPRQDYWSGLPFPPPEVLFNPGVESASVASPALSGRFFTTEPPGKPNDYVSVLNLTHSEGESDQGRKRPLVSHHPASLHHIIQHINIGKRSLFKVQLALRCSHTQAPVHLAQQTGHSSEKCEHESPPKTYFSQALKYSRPSSQPIHFPVFQPLPLVVPILPNLPSLCPLTA